MKTAVVLVLTALTQANGNACLSREMWAMATTSGLAEGDVIGLVCRNLASPSQRDAAGWATVHGDKLRRIAGCLELTH